MIGKFNAEKIMNVKGKLLWIGALLIIVGGLFAHFTQTSGGILIQDVRFTGANATPMSGLLYIPSNATAKTPAPGILAVHGYINSRETQSGFAIEYARRGYVVLALDQTGHGFSGGFAFGNGFGGPDGLKYLRSLDIVDVNNIGMEGHSMGGGSILAAALAYPDDYKSMVLEGSATRTLFSPAGDATFPRNVAVVFSQYDEFSQMMWGVASGKQIVDSPKLLALFGTDTTVVTQQVYGSIEDGTARVLYTPATTHPGDHISHEAIGDSIEWFQKTLSGGTPLPRTDQIWLRKEIGTLIALVGFVAVLLGAFDALLRQPYFAVLQQAGTPVTDKRRAKWWLLFALTALVPVLTFYYFFGLGAKWMPPSRWFPQSITNQVIVWALLNGAITVALGFVFKRSSAQARTRWMPSILIAIATAAVGYIALLLADFFFKIDFRFWVVALKLMSLAHFKSFLLYLAPFTLFFIIAFRSLHGFLAVTGDSPARQYLSGIGALALGFALFLLAQYIPLFTNGALLVPTQALNAIISIQFLPLMIVLAIVSVFTWRRTHHYLPGALIAGLFVTWYIVAGTATQFRG
jgi:pimeloyl-ACP methyl ester carboxylesterase